MQLDPGLEQLRRCFAWIFLFTGATNIVIMIVVRMMLTEHTGLITDMQLSGQRQVLIQVSLSCIVLCEWMVPYR